jgi:hypothetical protein
VITRVSNNPGKTRRKMSLFPKVKGSFIVEIRQVNSDSRLPIHSQRN